MKPLAAATFAAVRAYARVAPTERGGFHLAKLARKTLPRDQWNGRFVTPDRLALDLDLGTYPDVCMAFGLYEKDTARALARLLKKGSHFADVGANLGYFTLLAARKVGDGGRVDAFEPDPANRARLIDHLQLNALADRVSVHPAAASDAPGTLPLYHPTAGAHNHGESSFFPSQFGPDAPSATATAVPTVRLDAALDRVPDVVKLDVEGAELAAIRGMAGWLTSPRPPALIVEHNPRSASAAGYAPGDLFRAVLQCNLAYRCRWIGLRLWDVPTPAALDAIARQGNVLYDAPPLAASQTDAAR